MHRSCNWVWDDTDLTSEKMRKIRRKTGGRGEGRVTNKQDDKDISKGVQDTSRKEITINLGVCARVGVCPGMVLIAKEGHHTMSMM